MLGMVALRCSFIFLITDVVCLLSVCILTTCQIFMLGCDAVTNECLTIHEDICTQESRILSRQYASINYAVNNPVDHSKFHESPC